MVRKTPKAPSFGLKAALAACVLALAGAGVAWDLRREMPPAPTPVIPVEMPAVFAGAPDFSFADLEGRRHALRDFHGKTVLLHFWASWCPPCVEEFPALAALAQTRRKDLVVIALSGDADSGAIHAFLKRQTPATRHALKEAQTPIALDEGRRVARELFMTVRYPETILIGPDGTMRRKIVGPTDWTGPTLAALLDEAARGSVGASSR